MGSYAATIGGTSGEALEDFTGGVLEAIDLKDAKYASSGGRQELFDTLLVYQERASLMGASIAVLDAPHRTHSSTHCCIDHASLPLLPKAESVALECRARREKASSRTASTATTRIA